MRQWAFLGCRLLGFAFCALAIPQLAQVFLYLQMDESLRQWTGQVVWTMLSGPILMLVSGFVCFQFAPMWSRLLAPVEQDEKLAAPTASAAQAFQIGMGLLGVWLIVKDLPIVAIFAGLWFWSSYTVPPEWAQTVLNTGPKTLLYAVPETVVGIALAGLATSGLRRNPRS